MTEHPDTERPMGATPDVASACHYCGRQRSDWNKPCPNSPDALHWTAAEKIGTLEIISASYVRHLREANRLLLVGASALAAVKVRSRRTRRRAIRQLPPRPDSLDLQTEAAKISDTIAIYTGDQSLPVR